MNEKLLARILGLLVEEYGLPRVEAALATLELGPKSFDQSAHTEHREKPAKRKLSPVEVAQRAKVPVGRRQLLVQLAEQFESKSFLPANSDLREFLEMRGWEWRGATPRNDGFRKVFDVLLELTDDELKSLLEAASQTAVMRLGPLSDAIDEAGAARRGASDKRLPPSSSEDAS